MIPGRTECMRLLVSFQIPGTLALIGILNVYKFIELLEMHIERGMGKRTRICTLLIDVMQVCVIRQRMNEVT